MANKRKSRVDASGRNPDRIGSGDRVLIIRRSLWQSPHVSALSVTSRALMLDLLSMYNGKNNATLFLSLRDATDRLGCSDQRVAMTAFEELQQAKLISRTVIGHFRIKAGEVSKAQAWRLNFIDEDGKPRSADALPSLDPASLTPQMRKRMDKRQRALKRYLKDKSEGKFAAEENAALEARLAEENAAEGETTAEENAALNRKNGRNALQPSAEENAAHIYHHSPEVFETAVPPPDAARDSNAFAECEHCGERFLRTKPTKTYCCRDCKERAKQRRHYQRQRAAELQVAAQ